MRHSSWSLPLKLSQEPSSERLPGSIYSRANLNIKVGQAALSKIAEYGDEQFLCLTTIGRKAGLRREIEIWFVVYGERFYLLLETGEATWMGQEYPTESEGHRPGRGMATGCNCARSGPQRPSGAVARGRWSRKSQVSMGRRPAMEITPSSLTPNHRRAERTPRRRTSARL